MIRKEPGSNVFIATSDSIIIGRGTLITLLNYLVDNDIIPVSVLSGIVEEYFTR